MLKNFWVMSIILLMATIASAGWEYIYGGMGSDFGRAVVQTADGSGYVIVGTLDLSPINSSVCLIKMGIFGDTLWTKTYSGDDRGEGFSLQQTTDGGYVIAGSINENIYLVKTDLLGDTLWTKNINLGGHDIASSVQQTTDGGYIITGTTIETNYNIFLIKTNPAGDMLWTKIYIDSLEHCDNTGQSVQQTTDGGYIIVGFTADGGHCDAWLIKTDSLGDTLWTKTYNASTGFALGYSIVQTTDDGYAIVGAIDIDTIRYVWLVKTDSLGDTLWTKIYYRGRDSEGYSIEQTSDGGYIITGHTNGRGNSDVYLLKTDSLGDTLWTKIYSRIGEFAVGYAVTQTADKGYIITGMNNQSKTGLDIYIIKTDSLGCSAIQENRMPQSQALEFSAFPNPFNASTIISYKLSRPTMVNLLIFDIRGKLVKQLINKYQTAGVYTTTWNAIGLSSGVYFCKLITNHGQQSTRIVIVK